jgi:hypothetical protein
MHRLCLSVVVIGAAAVGLVTGVAGAAPAGARMWVPCAGHPKQVRNLQASRMTCRRARRAVRRGKVALTPGGPLFTTPRFKCDSPIGPPLPPNLAPRFTLCTHGHRAFRFYSSSEPSRHTT